MNKRVRIFLNETSTDCLKAMIKEMRKHKGVSLSPSELGSWILDFFFKTQFEKSKPEIIKSFTDFKKLVRDNLKGAISQEDFIHSLKDSLAIAQTNKGIKRTPAKNGIKTNLEELKDK